MGAELYPLTLEPIVAEHFWGRSAEMAPADETLPPGFNLGTLWMATDNSRIAAGPQAGKGLGYLKQLWGPNLVGSATGGDPDGLLPVELKLKRTGSAALAVALTDYSLWYVLSADEDSSINAGYLPDLDFAAAARTAGGDPGRWSEYMPEYSVEAGQCLFLPPLSPLLLGAGLTVAQIGPPTRTLPHWPLPDLSPDSLALAAESLPPFWLPSDIPDSGVTEVFHSEGLTVNMVSTVHLSTIASSEATTFIWPIIGQGRIRARGPAPVTRLQPGRVVMVPAGLGRYAVESGGSVTYLLIEAF